MTKSSFQPILIPFFAQLRYAGRSESAVPATGLIEVHKQECAKIIEDTFK